MRHAYARARVGLRVVGLVFISGGKLALAHHQGVAGEHLAGHGYQTVGAGFDGGAYGHLVAYLELVQEVGTRAGTREGILGPFELGAARARYDAGHDTLHLFVGTPGLAFDRFDDDIDAVDVAFGLTRKVVVEHNFVFVADAVNLGDGKALVGGVGHPGFEIDVVDPHFLLLVEHHERNLLQPLDAFASVASVPVVGLGGKLSVHHTTAVRLAQEVVHALSRDNPEVAVYRPDGTVPRCREACVGLGHGLGRTGMVFADEGIYVVVGIVEVDGEGVDVEGILGHVHAHILHTRAHRTALERIDLFRYTGDVDGGVCTGSAEERQSAYQDYFFHNSSDCLSRLFYYQFGGVDLLVTNDLQQVVARLQPGNGQGQRTAVAMPVVVYGE